MSLESGKTAEAALESRNFQKQVSSQVWALAWPMMLSNLSTPILGLVDAAVMGHLSDSRYLAAIAVGATVFSSLYWALAFLKAGTTGLAAQAYGKGDRGALSVLVWRALCLAFILGLLLIICQNPVLSLAQWVFSPPAESIENVRTYFLIRIWGAPAALMTLVLIGWFVGNHNTRVPLLILLGSTLINACLNLLLVLGFGMKAAGVAWGTLIAEYFGLCIAVVYLRRSASKELAEYFWQSINTLHPFIELLRLNGDYFLRTLCLIFTFAFFTRQGALNGKDMVAVNEILKTFLLLIALCLDGFAHASEALAGSSWSARNWRLFRVSVRLILRWTIVMSLALSVFFGLTGRMIIALLTDIPELIVLANTYIIWIVFLPLVGMWSFFFDGLFIGLTDTRAMRNNMFVSVFLVFLPCWYMTQSWGNHGLWFAMMSFFASRGVGLGWIFLRKYWKQAYCT